MSSIVDIIKITHNTRVEKGKPLNSYKMMLVEGFNAFSHGSTHPDGESLRLNTNYIILSNTIKEAFFEEFLKGSDGEGTSKDQLHKVKINDVEMYQVLGKGLFFMDMPWHTQIYMSAREYNSALILE